MKLANLYVNDQCRIGARIKDGFAIYDHTELNAPLATEIGTILNKPNMLEEFKRQLETGTALVVSDLDVKYRPAVERPGKIICIGLNYRRHALETNAPIPEEPVVFSKFSDTVASHNEDILLPVGSRKVDYEAELAIVIGRKAHCVTRDSALDYVFGYCNANDISARDLQNRTSQWLLGKTCPQFAPLGPIVVTADEISNPNTLGIRTYRNGELVQNSNTEDMIFSCDYLIHYLSQYMILQPGDLVLTGTPEGVILGQSQSERQWLQHGDEIIVEIEGIGQLRNRMVNV